MNNFSFSNSVKIIFGKGSIAKIAEEIPADARVLMTYGGGSIKKNGVYEQVKKAMEGRVLFEFGGIEPNPHFETCMKAVELCKKETPRTFPKPLLKKGLWTPKNFIHWSL